MIMAIAPVTFERPVRLGNLVFITGEINANEGVTPGVGTDTIQVDVSSFVNEVISARFQDQALMTEFQGYDSGAKRFRNQPSTVGTRDGEGIATCETIPDGFPAAIAVIPKSMDPSGPKVSVMFKQAVDNSDLGVNPDFKTGGKMIRPYKGKFLIVGRK